MKGFLIAIVCLPLPAWAVETEDINMVWLATASALVFLMQAGFALLESGMSRAKNALNVVMKNYMDVCLGTLVFWFLGYGLMFGDNPSGLYGTSGFAPADFDTSTWGIMLFQIMFAATAATIASGAMAERTRYNAYLIGAAVIIGFIYPVAGSWIWSDNGWLAKLGFVDFAGSTVVHSVGGWCALAGVLILGPRLGRYDQKGHARTIRGHNLSLVALGGFILWFGWFGFNGGSTLIASADIGLINLNTQLAAAAGASGSVVYALLRRRPILLAETVNGSLAGLVSITAGCATMTPPWALLTGAVGGMLCSIGSGLMVRMRLDDVVGAVPVHGLAGAWGTLAAGLFFAGDLFDQQRVAVQMLGITAVFAWVFFTALILYLVIALTTGLRAPTQHEQRGLDLTEHAEIGYPEFSVQTPYSTDIADQVEPRS